MPSPEELERMAKLRPSLILDQLREELQVKAKATFDKKEKEYEQLLQRLPNNRRF